MYCLNLFPFFKYLINIEQMNICWPVTLQSTLMIQIILYANGVHLDRRMMDKILYVADNSEIIQ